MSYLLDSSVLAKVFYHEAGSPAALALWKDSTNTLLATRLTMVEMASVNAIRIRQGATGFGDGSGGGAANRG